MTAAVKPQPSEVVIRHTGEVKDVAPFDMATFLVDIKNPAHIAQQNALASAYDAACAAIIGPNDVQVEGQRTFKKKSAWRKLARYFTISTRVVRVEREHLPTGDFLATVTVEAAAPWGQSAEAVGACCTDEATGRRVITVADAIATAETRATNRATSNLIAMGEVSAEEMGERSRGGGSASPKDDSEKRMPFGKQKGLALKAIDTADLRSTVEWCKTKDAAKFADLIAACERVIASRSSKVASPEGADEWEEFPPALRDEDDDLPF